MNTEYKFVLKCKIFFGNCVALVSGGVAAVVKINVICKWCSIEIYQHNKLSWKIPKVVNKTGISMNAIVVNQIYEPDK